MHLQIIAGLLLFIIVLTWDVLTDYNKWRQEKPVKHASEALLRMVLLLPSVILFSVAHPAESGYTWSTLRVLVSTIWMLGAIWWLLFDGWYNSLRGLSWWYNGSFNDSGHPDAWADKFLFKLGHPTAAIFKVALALGGCICYIVSFLNS